MSFLKDWDFAYSRDFGMSALVTLGKISGLSDFSCLAFKFLPPTCKLALLLKIIILIL